MMYEERFDKLCTVKLRFSVNNETTSMQQLKYEQYWIKQFEELKVYYDANGHSNVPRWFKENNPQLGSWVSKQRCHYMDTLELLWE